MQFLHTAKFYICYISVLDTKSLGDMCLDGWTQVS